MTEKARALPPTHGNPPHEVSAEEYVEKYAHDHYEWEQGRLVKLHAEETDMTEQTISPSQGQGDTPRQVSAEEYMEKYAHDHYEWEQGRLIKLSPITALHDRLTNYLRQLFDAYFALRPIGQIFGEPFVMRIDAIDSRREPDLQVILNSNSGDLTPTAMIGPADICIEVVLEESISRDYGKKFMEYEKGGVPEYWIVDPIRRAASFHRRNAEGLYQLIQPDEAGNYETPLLPGLKTHVPTLWQEPLPDIIEIVNSVRAMLGA